MTTLSLFRRSISLALANQGEWPCSNPACRLHRSRDEARARKQLSVSLGDPALDAPCSTVNDVRYETPAACQIRLIVATRASARTRTDEVFGAESPYLVSGAVSRCIDSRRGFSHAR